MSLRGKGSLWSRILRLRQETRPGTTHSYGESSESIREQFKAQLVERHPAELTEEEDRELTEEELLRELYKAVYGEEQQHG